MEEEKENRPMSDVMSIKTDSGRPVRNTKRLNYQLVHSGKISGTKRKTAKAPVSGNSSKVPDTHNINNTQVPDSNNKKSEELPDTANKTDLHLTRMDQDSNTSLPSGKLNEKESRKSADKESVKISVTIQEPKDEVDLYLGNTFNTEDEGNAKIEAELNINAEDVRNTNIDENADSLDEGNSNAENKINANTEEERNANTEDNGNATLKPGESNGIESIPIQRQISEDASIVEIDDISEESAFKRPVRSSKRPNYSLLHKGPNLNLNRHEQREMKEKPTQIDEDDNGTLLSEKDISSDEDPTSANSSQIILKENEASSSSPKQNCTKESDDTLAEEEDSSSSPNKKLKCCSDENVKKHAKVSSKNTKKSRDGIAKKDDFEIDESEEESEQQRSDQKDLIVTLRNFFDDNHLNFEPRSPTKADGNCFFRSIVDQLELHQIPHQPTTHKKLRLEISNFLGHLPDNVMQTTVDVVFKGKKSGLKNLAYRQKKPGQFVDNNGIMVMATGLFLKRQIDVHSKTPDDCHCVTKIEGGEGSENLDPLTIFYFQDHQHYQSICKTV